MNNEDSTTRNNVSARRLMLSGLIINTILVGIVALFVFKFLSLVSYLDSFLGSVIGYAADILFNHFDYVLKGMIVLISFLLTCLASGSIYYDFKDKMKNKKEAQ